MRLDQRKRAEDYVEAVVVCTQILMHCPTCGSRARALMPGGPCPDPWHHGGHNPGGQPPPGPREVRYLLELTLAYSNGLKDVIDVFESTMRERPEVAFRYARLLDGLHSLVSPGEGGLVAVAQECRVLLGLEVT